MIVQELQEGIVNSNGMIVAVIGLIIIVLAVANHFAHFMLNGTAHVDIYIGVVGLVVAALGAWMGMRKAA